MSNKIFEKLLVDEIETFRNSFSNVSKDLFTNSDEKLFHPGEYGMYREAISRKFIKSFSPAHLDIDQGFLINSKDDLSTQCDIVIYDARFTPLLKNRELQRFFPVETTSAIGEVKSNLSFTNFKTALIKLARTKEISEYVKNPSVIYRNKQGDFSPMTYPNDLVTTFLICQKLDFDIKRIEEVYDDSIKVRHRHNMILSMEDGLILYEWSTKERIGMHYLPTIDGIRQQNFGFYSIREAGISCFKVFCNYLFEALCFRTLMFTQISDYMEHYEHEQ
jgi:hypothetical protein